MEYLIGYLPYLGISLMIICGLAQGIKRLIKEESSWIPLFVSSGGLFLLIIMLTEC